MRLLIKELRAQLPSIAAQRNSANPIVFAKLYLPDSSFRWYLTGGMEMPDGDFLLSGYLVSYYCDRHLTRLASDLAHFRGPRGYKIRKDRRFKPKRFTEVLQAEARMIGLDRRQHIPQLVARE